MVRGVTTPTVEDIKTAIMSNGAGSLNPTEFTDTQERAISNLLLRCTGIPLHEIISASVDGFVTPSKTTATHSYRRQHFYSTNPRPASMASSVVLNSVKQSLPQPLSASAWQLAYMLFEYDQEEISNGHVGLEQFEKERLALLVSASEVFGFVVRQIVHLYTVRENFISGMNCPNGLANMLLLYETNVRRIKEGGGSHRIPYTVVPTGLTQYAVNCLKLSLYTELDLFSRFRKALTQGLKMTGPLIARVYALTPLRDEGAESFALRVQAHELQAQRLVIYKGHGGTHPALHPEVILDSVLMGGLARQAADNPLTHGLGSPAMSELLTMYNNAMDKNESLPFRTVSEFIHWIGMQPDKYKNGPLFVAADLPDDHFAMVGQTTSRPRHGGKGAPSNASAASQKGKNVSSDRNSGVSKIKEDDKKANRASQGDDVQKLQHMHLTTLDQKLVSHFKRIYGDPEWNERYFSFTEQVVLPHSTHRVRRLKIVNSKPLIVPKKEYNDMRSKLSADGRTLLSELLRRSLKDKFTRQLAVVSPKPAPVQSYTATSSSVNSEQQQQQQPQGQMYPTLLPPLQQLPSLQPPMYPTPYQLQHQQHQFLPQPPLQHPGQFQPPFPPPFGGNFTGGGMMMGQTPMGNDACMRRPMLPAPNARPSFLDGAYSQGAEVDQDSSSM